MNAIRCPPLARCAASDDDNNRMVIESIDASAARPPWSLRALALLAGLAGLLTIRAGALAVFGNVDVGTAVPFVLWFNFLAGFAYVAAAGGLWALRPWSAWLAAAIAASTALVLAMFGLNVAGGGAFEARTMLTLVLRTAGWCAIAGLAFRHLADDERG